MKTRLFAWQSYHHTSWDPANKTESMQIILQEAISIASSIKQTDAEDISNKNKWGHLHQHATSDPC